MMLRQLEVDGRQPVSELARKLGVSRANASRRLKRLIDSKITRIMAFTNPLVLGYRTVAIITIRVSPRDIRETADKLSALPNVHLVVIAAGQHDIIVWAMFRTTEDLSKFLERELGAISGIKGTQTMMVLETKKRSFDFSAASYRDSDEKQPLRSTRPDKYVAEELANKIDQTDLTILRELENDARQSVSDLAKKLGTSRAYASMKLNRLLEHRLTKIAAFTDPTTLGYPVFASIGIRLSPNDIDTAANTLREYAEVHTVVKVAGQYDIFIETHFSDPKDLSKFLMEELSCIPGIISTETMIALEPKKMSLMRLLSSHLQADRNVEPVGRY